MNPEVRPPMASENESNNFWLNGILAKVKGLLHSERRIPKNPISATINEPKITSFKSRLRGRHFLIMTKANRALKPVAPKKDNRVIVVTTKPLDLCIDMEFPEVISKPAF